MSIRILAFAAGAAAIAFAAPALGTAQPQQQAGDPAAASADDRDGQTVVVTETHRDGQDGQSAHSDGSGRVQVYTIRTDGGTYTLHGDGGAGDHVVTLRAKDGHAYRVGDGVVVLRTKDGHRYRVRDEDRHVIMLSSAGEPGRRLVLDGAAADCVDHPLVDRASPDGRDHTRVVLCGHGQLSEADRTAQLERVLERMQHMEGLSDSSRERVTAALREAIEELHSAH
jgi:hypothetical protein